MTTIPNSTAIWDWDAHCDYFTTACYIGSRNFDESLEQYWEITNSKNPNNVIGLVWRRGRSLEIHGSTTAPAGLLWDLEERSVSFFFDNIYQAVLWKDVPSGFAPLIKVWPCKGHPGRRTTRGLSLLVILCRKRIMDLVDTVER